MPNNVAIETQRGVQMALLGDCFLTHCASWVFYYFVLIDKRGRMIRFALSTKANFNILKNIYKLS